VTRILINFIYLLELISLRQTASYSQFSYVKINKSFRIHSKTFLSLTMICRIRKIPKESRWLSKPTNSGCIKTTHLTMFARQFELVPSVHLDIHQDTRAPGSQAPNHCNELKRKY
jgi:hypothetical protein